MSTSINRVEATAMWDALRDHFTNAADAIKTIIANRAWEPLGYGSFAEAWRHEMRGVVLAGEIRAHVVYQLLEEQVPVQDVADMVGGVGPVIAEALSRQRENGVPADCAVVSEHLRRKPRPADTLHIKIGATLLYEYRRVAAVQGETVEEICREALREKFAAIVAAQAKTKGAAS